MANEWQPIATAPRDGSKVLVTKVREDGSYAWMYVAWNRRTQWRITENVTRNYYSTVDDEPTHWMPLPPPPRTTMDDAIGDDEIYVLGPVTTDVG